MLSGGLSISVEAWLDISQRQGSWAWADSIKRDLSRDPLLEAARTEDETVGRVPPHPLLPTATWP